MAMGKKTGGRNKGVLDRTKKRMRDELAQSGLMPLGYLFWPSCAIPTTESRRDWAAEKAAPCCHPRLASTELSGPNNGPMEVVTYTRAKALPDFMPKTARSFVISPPPQAADVEQSDVSAQGRKLR